MPLVRISAKHQVVIPKEVFNDFGLSPGDYVDVTRQGSQIVMRPKKVVDREEEWMQDPAVLKEIRLALKEMNDGKTGPALTTQEEIQSYLDELKKK